MFRRCFLFLTLIFAYLSGAAEAQYYFGKNKVQYTQFDWQWMQTPHFDVYFYPEEREIAEAGAAMAEESFVFLERKFVHTPLRRIPLIFYSSPLFFQQTNTISHSGILQDVQRGPVHCAIYGGALWGGQISPAVRALVAERPIR